MRRTLFLIAMLLVVLSADAQPGAIDSLKSELQQKTLHDTSRILTMMRLAVKYEAVDSNLSASMYQEAIALSVQKRAYYYTGLVYRNESFLYNASGDYENASVCLDSALYFLQRADAHPNKDFNIARTYSSMATNRRYKGNYKEAVEYSMKAIGLFERLDIKPSLLSEYINLSNLHKEMNEFLKQEAAARKALAIASQTGIGKDFFNAYFTLALAFVMQNKYQEAKGYLDSARQHYAVVEAYSSLLSFHLVAGLNDMNLNELKSAAAHFTTCAELAEKNKDIFGKIQARLQLSRVLALQKEFADAEKVLLSAEADYQKTSGIVHKEILLDYKSRLYEEWGDYKKALLYYKEYKALTDSIASDQNKAYATKLEVQFEAEKREAKLVKQAADLRQKNMLTFIFAGTTVAVILLALLLYRNYNQKRKLQQQRINDLETQQQLTATEAVLKGEEQERTRLAKDLHDGLGGMLSSVKYSLNTMKGNLIMTPDNAQAFERSIDMLDSSIKEMRRVAHNMMPEALVKFGLDTALKDFCNDVNQSGVLKVHYESIGMQDAGIEQTTAITIYRIVQELLNNILKHAAAKNAIVQLSKSENNIAITVEDDGKGFDTTALQSVQGIGWGNIKNRVEFLKGTLDVNSKKEEGTSVLIELPFDV